MDFGPAGMYMWGQYQMMITRQKRCDESGNAYAGSQKQIQLYVNEQPELLNRAIEDIFAKRFDLQWVSPLKRDRYRKYKDVEFLIALGIRQYGPKLIKFWPKGGPRWDALACATSESNSVLLVEAKSHIPEMYAGDCKATSATSLQMIGSSIAKTKDWLGVNPDTDWLGKFEYKVKASRRCGCLYQTANRIAHLYFLREVLGVEAWLVNVCFVDDPYCRTTQMEWELGMAEAKKNLGISNVPFAADVFLPALK
jgi:hypothetical protein